MDKKKVILQTVKYYKPSKGGMESVVETIVNGVSSTSNRFRFLIYSNTHRLSLFNKEVLDGQNTIIKEATPIILKSQPLNIRYSKLKQLIKESDVIHHHYPFPTMELALLYYHKMVRSKELIITWHANIQNSRWSNIGLFYNPIIERLLIHAKYIVVTSPQLLDNSKILQKYSFKVKVVPLSFDGFLNEKDLNPRTLEDRKVKKVLFVGKLRKYKGVKYLIDALKTLTDIELIIVGVGEEERMLKKQAGDNGMINRVRFMNNVNNETLKILYKEADLFVLPSINEAEAFGVVQLEAMANGLPVINTKLDSGVPFVSLNNVTGFTVMPEDSEALRCAIENIFVDKDLYASFSKNAIERVKLFSTDKLVKSYMELYE